MKVAWENISINEQLDIIALLEEYFPGLNSEELEKKAKKYYETRNSTHK